MSINRILADLGKAVDSSSTGDFLNKEASGAEFNPVQWSDINSAPTILDSDLASESLILHMFRQDRLELVLVVLTLQQQ